MSWSDLSTSCPQAGPASGHFGAKTLESWACPHLFLCHVSEEAGTFWAVRATLRTFLDPRTSSLPPARQ